MDTNTDSANIQTDLLTDTNESRIRCHGSNQSEQISNATILHGEDFFDESNLEFINVPLYSPWDVPPNNLVAQAHTLGQRRQEVVLNDLNFAVPEKDKDADIYMDAFSKSDDDSDADLDPDSNDGGNLASFMNMFKAKSQAQSDVACKGPSSTSSKIIDEERGTKAGNTMSSGAGVMKSKLSAVEQYKLRLKELEEKNFRPNVLNPKIEIPDINSEKGSLYLKEIEISISSGSSKKCKKQTKVPSSTSAGISVGLGMKTSPQLKRKPQTGLAAALAHLAEEEKPLLQSEIQQSRKLVEGNNESAELSQRPNSPTLQASKELFSKFLAQTEKKAKKHKGKSGVQRLQEQGRLGFQ